VTDNKGKPRCPDGFHRSPDGDCERVSNSARYNDNDDDDKEKDRDDNDDRKDHNDNNQKNYGLDLPNPDRDEKKRNDFAVNDNGIVLGCSYGFYRAIDGDCKPIVTEPIVTEPIISVDVQDNDKNKNIESVSNLNKPKTDYEDFVYTSTDESNSFFDRLNNFTYLVVDSKEILVLQNKDLVNKLTVNNIEDPVYNANKDSIYFVDSSDKLNVYDDGILKQIETQLKIDNLAYNPSNHYIYAINTAYGKIFVINDQQIIKSLDTGLSKVDYLTYNPSNGYMYGVDKDFLHNILVINGLDIINTIQLNESAKIDFLAYNPSNGYMYGADSNGKKVIVLHDRELERMINIGYKVDFLAYNPTSELIYAIGNEQENDKLDLIGSDSTSSASTLPSGGLQPLAQIQQFNQDTGNGPQCCKSSSSLNYYQSNSLEDFSQPSNGKITIINGTEKIHNMVFNDPIENVAYNLNDKFLYLLSTNPGKLTTINDTRIVDSKEIGGNPEKILFNPNSGLMYVTKENNYEYSIDVFENLLLKSNIPIKYLYDGIIVNHSNGLIYMVDGDIVYVIEGGSVIDKIILNI
jgi:hypothetical protein